MEKQEFIQSILEGAMAVYEKYNILPSLTIAQAILESNWGKSSLAVKGKNLFGIKAKDNYRNVITLPTYEYIDRQKVKVDANFKVYSSFKDSILDHNILLGTSKRYENVRNSKDYKEGAMALYSCGYATDPDYAQKLISIVECYSLYNYDIKSHLYISNAYDFVVKNNISDGFRPKDFATREELWVMIYRLSKALNKPL